MNKVRGEEDSTDVPIFPTSGWQNFPAYDLPKGFCYGAIYDHIIASAQIVQIGESDSESEMGITDFNTTKPMLKGRQYFTSGHVKNIKHQIKDKFHFIKCNVMASYTMKTNYNVCITLTSTSGKVMDAACDCKASAMGRCNHIAALLFAIEDYIMKFGHQVAPTSKLCTWNTGRKNKCNPQPCHSTDYNKKLKPDRIISFDPRPEDVDHKTFVNKFIATLPSSSSDSMMQQVLELKYSDYTVDKEALKKMTDAAITLLKSTCTGKAAYEVPNTREQSNSGQWHTSRTLRVTASMAKEVVSVKTSRAKYHLLKRLLWRKTLPDLKALQYGKKHENNAFDAYCQMKEINEFYEIEKSGLWINPKFPELGCSPDELIKSNDGNLLGVVEIKCPLVLENCHPLNTDSLKAGQRYNLCYRVENQEIFVKRTHAYYYQIQMKIAICEVDICDFVVWSPKGIKIQRVMRDKDFWVEICPKLIDFHHLTLMPEYLEMRVPRRLMPVEI